MKTLARFVFVVVILLIAGGGLLWRSLKEPYQGFQEAKILDFPRGTSTGEMAMELETNGVIRSSWLFRILKVLSPGAALQAGEYKFDKPESTLEVFRKIARGDTFYYELVVPEGQNMFDIAE